MIYLFLDTNIYLSFFHYSNDNLEELKKLLVAIDKQKIVLITTEQVIDEFYRNREIKIYDAIQIFQKSNLNKNEPSFIKQEDELYKKLVKHKKEYEKCKKKIIEQTEKNFKDNSFEVDQIILELFNKSSVLGEDSQILDNAERRVKRGRPPGKKKSLGDSIIWEVLLKKYQYKDDLHFISADGDFESKLLKKELNSYLANEWKKKKGVNLIFYTDLSSFFKEKYPNIKIATDLEKELAIENLVNSFMFASTHTAISVLSNYLDTFTKTDILRIVEGGLENNQIYYINKDPDVKDFFTAIYERYKNFIPTGKLKSFEELYILEDDDNVEEI